MVQILSEDFYKLDETMQAFGADCVSGNPYQHDEYNFAQALKDAIQNKDYAEILQTMKKPLFGFLDNEIVKQLKVLAMNPPTVVVQSEGASSEDHKKKILDNMLL